MTISMNEILQHSYDFLIISLIIQLSSALLGLRGKDKSAEH